MISISAGLHRIGRCAGGRPNSRPKLGTTCSDFDAVFCSMTGSYLLPVILQKAASKSEQVVPSFGLSSADPPHNGQCDASPLKC